MGLLSIDPPSHKGKTDTWLTPLWIPKALGEFDLDPCGFLGHETAKSSFILPVDGLSAKWSGKVWLNPPYSDIEPWMDKLSNHGFGTAIVFARTDTAWMQRHLRLADSVFFIKGRVKFLTPEFKEKTNGGSPSVLLSYGWHPNYEKIKGYKAK